MRRIIGLTVCALCALSLLFGFQRVRVLINGKETREVMVSGGKVYVAVNALREAGAVVTTSSNEINIQFEPIRGRLQGDMVEGRIGEWLSNGTWRVRVTKVEPTENPFYGRGKGYAVTIEVRNLTERTLSLSGSGFANMYLLDDRGNKLAYADSKFSQRYDRIVRADGFTARVPFGVYGDPKAEVGEVEKLLIEFRSTGGQPALKGFRIFLKEPATESSGEG